MKIGFDIDGVVFEQDLVVLRQIDLMTDEKVRNELSKYYYLHRKIELNPLLFLLYPDDELYLITGRNEKYREVTEWYVQRFFPNAKLIMCNHKEPASQETILMGWFVSNARLKARYINELKIEVYIEDCPEVARELRELCSDCKIICYGGRHEE